MSKRAFSLIALLLGLTGFAAPAIAAAAAAPLVVVVPIHGTIDDGMAHLVQRAVSDAKSRHAAAIALDVDTFGGLVSAGTAIRDALIESPVPVVAFVHQRAWSAGALVTLAAGTIVMSPQSSIGAAEPIPATVKTISALRKEFESTAQLHHRSPALVAQMVDPSTNGGKILTLRADEAKADGIANALASDLPSALAAAGFANAQVADANYTFGERLARFATDPTVSGILLSLGMLGLLLEMQTLHGIAGALGIGAFALFFGSHVYAGFSDWAVAALALFGLVAILFELHVFPGHGISAGIGVIALLAAVLMAFGGFAFVFVGLQSLAIAIVLSAIAFWASLRVFPESAFLRRLTLTAVQGRDYVTSADFTTLVGHTGVAASMLRPAGVATIDGQRVDVLTDGDFLPAGMPVRVTRVEGARIFVRALE